MGAIDTSVFDKRCSTVSVSNSNYVCHGWLGVSYCLLPAGLLKQKPANERARERERDRVSGREKNILLVFYGDN
jgi:hypothetical protein